MQFLDTDASNRNMLVDHHLQSLYRRDLRSGYISMLSAGDAKHANKHVVGLDARSFGGGYTYELTPTRDAYVAVRAGHPIYQSPSALFDATY